jgi:hypothetical protein
MLSVLIEDIMGSYLEPIISPFVEIKFQDSPILRWNYIANPARLEKCFIVS